MNNASRTEKWPNFLKVGAARAGTTTLYEYLRTVPDIYFPNTKEPRYFLAKSKTDDICGREAIWDKHAYMNLFIDSNAAIIGEATPEYLYRKMQPNRSPK